MKKKILWMLLSFLLVAALVLASCAKEEVVVEEEEEEEEEEAVVDEEEEEEEEPAVGEPQRGGTITLYNFSGEPASADLIDRLWPTVVFTDPVMETLGTGDFEKYGPRGTKEWHFIVEYYIPEKYRTGLLAESWEVTPDKVIFNIRPGVYWAAYGKEHVMESREYTAYDTVFSLNRFLDSGAGDISREIDWVKSIYPEDKYTVVVETNFFSSNWFDWIACGRNNAQYPEEVVDAGASDWNNLVGTGPFMVKEHVAGSHFTYERNPNYYRTTTINGKEYPIPFVDELVYPIMPDESTRLAALRTGTLDLARHVGLVHEDTLAQTCPDLIKFKFAKALCSVIVLNLNSEPFSNKEVRRALMIGLDREAIMRAVFFSGPYYHEWPIGSFSDIQTPVDELPASTRELLDYDPVKAKKMLADAGYPEGSLKLEYLSESGPGPTDTASMVVAMWAEIGVETELTVKERSAYYRLIDSREGYDVTATNANNMNPLENFSVMFISEGSRNHANYNNPYFDEQVRLSEQMTDHVAREAIYKELAVIALDDVPYIPFGGKDIMTCWWPWLKNYTTEFDCGGKRLSPLLARAWIDQALKAEMGY